MNTSSTVYNKTPHKVSVKLKKTGTPTGTITIAVLQGTSTTHSALTIHSIGTMDAATLTTTATDYTFTNLSQSHAMAVGERIVVLFSGGNSLNTVDVSRTTLGGTKPNEDRVLLSSGGVWGTPNANGEITMVVWE
jgi:hypothetical protein